MSNDASQSRFEKPSSHLKPGGACPACGSCKLEKAPRSVYRSRFFVLRRPLRCGSCGVIVIPRSGPPYVILGIVVGIAMLTVGITMYVYPNYAHLGNSLISWLELVIGVITTGGGCVIVWRCAEELLPRSWTMRR